MSYEKQSRTKRVFTSELKSQTLQLHHQGERKCDIQREYEVAVSLLDKWIKQSETTGSFKDADNRTPEQKELIELRKRNKHLEMENDILKQAALISGRK